MNESQRKLIDKLSAELEQYRQYLLTMKPEEILNHAWQWTIKQDIVFCLEEHDIDEDKCEELLKRDGMLEGILSNYNNMETDYMVDIQTAIEDYAYVLQNSSNNN